VSEIGVPPSVRYGLPSFSRFLGISGGMVVVVVVVVVVANFAENWA
jgi:hypothetical protein